MESSYTVFSGRDMIAYAFAISVMYCSSRGEPYIVVDCRLYLWSQYN